jgi:hypothetical protein
MESLKLSCVPGDIISSNRLNDDNLDTLKFVTEFIGTKIQVQLETQLSKFKKDIVQYFKNSNEDIFIIAIFKQVNTKKICDIDTLTLPFLVNNILMIKYDNLSFKYNCKDLQSLLEQTIKDITEFNISLCNESDDVKTVYGLLRESNHLNQQKID